MTNRLSTAVAATIVIAAGILGAAEGAGQAATAQSTEAATETAQRHVRQYPACAQEDDTACIWHNSGPGFSFVSGIRHDSGQVWRVSDRLANKLQRREGTWRRPGHWRGVRIDDTHGGSFVIRRGDVVSVGGTTYVIRKSGRVGTS